MTRAKQNTYTIVTPTGKSYSGTVPEILRAFNKSVTDDRFKLYRGGLYRLVNGNAKKGLYKLCRLKTE